jgi:hypothetical protein
VVELENVSQTVVAAPEFVANPKVHAHPIQPITKIRTKAPPFRSDFAKMNQIF